MDAATSSGSGVVVIGDSLSAELVAAVAAVRGTGQVTTWAPDAATRFARRISVHGIGGSGHGEIVVSDRPDKDAGTFVYLGTARDWLPFLSSHATELSGKTLLVMGGGVAASAAATQALDKTAGVGHETVVAEIQSFPFLGDVDGNTYHLTGVKRGMGIGSLDPADAKAALATVDAWLPDLVVKPLLSVTFADVNPLIHPTICLANARLIDAGTEFGLFTEGLSPVVAALIEAMDGEKAQVLQTAGIPWTPVVETLHGFYADQGFREDSLLEALSSFDPYASAHGPADFQHRYFLDDVAVGLDPLVRLARAVDVATPLIDSVIGLSRHLTGAPLLGADRWDALGSTSGTGMDAQPGGPPW